MNTESATAIRKRIPHWRHLLFWPATVFLLVYLTQSLWLPYSIPLVMWKARSSQTSPAENRREWDFVRRRAMETKNQRLLQTVATEPTAPGEVRATAWASVAEERKRAGDLPKAADAYLSAMDCLTSGPNLSASGYMLRKKAWDEIRFALRPAINPERYRTSLMLWAERTSDQRFLEQLVFELGKLKLLTSAAPIQD